MEKEAEKYLTELNEKRGGATSARQIGQRRRRLKEKLYKISSSTTTDISFKEDDNDSLNQGIINAVVKSADIEDSVGQMIETYGSPAGGDIVDDNEYDDEYEEDETRTGYTLFPKNKSKLFGGKDSFEKWMKNVYLPARPELYAMVEFNYWRRRDGTLVWGKQRTRKAKNKALKWISYQLRKAISAKGITPNSVTISKTTTILNYDVGQHTLNKGRDV